MCLSLLALATSFGLLETVQVDEIKLNGNAITRLQDPVSECHVVGLSADGQKVVGYGTPVTNSGHSGFTWSKGKGVRELPLPAELRELASHGGAYSISDDGLVCGGTGLWIEKSSKIASLFTKTAVPINALAPLPLTDGQVGQLNRDGTVMVVEVAGAKGTKLFLWRASNRKLTPLLARDGQRLLGGVLDMSARGDVLVGCTFRETDPIGFIHVNGKYHQVPALAKYSQSKVECITDDGKVAFGTYSKGNNESFGFRWTVGTKPLPLPKQFLVQSISGKGEILGGWANDEPALLVGERVFLLDKILAGKLSSQVIQKSRIVAVKKIGKSVFLLIDTEDDTTDYRVALPASTLGLKG